MLLEQWRDDLRLAWRGLRRARGFTAAAVVTLAVGIAGTTTMFALIEGVLLRPLPVREQDRLLVAWTELRSTGFTHWPYKVEAIELFRDASQVLERTVCRHGRIRAQTLCRDRCPYRSGRDQR